MFKYLCLFVSFTAGYDFFNYAFNDVVPHRTTLLTWGFIVMVHFFTEAVVRLFKEKYEKKFAEAEKLAQERIKTLIKPIEDDTTLTNKEKQSKIAKVLLQEMTNEAEKITQKIDGGKNE